MRRSKNMKKKIVTLLTATTLALSISACGGNNNDNGTKEPDTKTPATTEEKTPTDLTGTWRSEENDGSYQEAIITENAIEINWVSDDGKTKDLYWAGTYTAPNEAIDEYSWVSENDTEKTDTALLASSDETKEFTYKDGKISYEASALGTTKIMELTKQE